MSDSGTEQQAAEDARRREELMEKVREANRQSNNRPCSPPAPVSTSDDEDPE